MMESYRLRAYFIKAEIHKNNYPMIHTIYHIQGLLIFNFIYYLKVVILHNILILYIAKENPY